MCCNRTIVCFVALAGGVAVWFAFQDQARSSGDRLERFEGRLSHELVTFEPVKSELATRAAEALKSGDAAEAERAFIGKRLSATRTMRVVTRTWAPACSFRRSMPTPAGNTCGHWNWTRTRPTLDMASAAWITKKIAFRRHEISFFRHSPYMKRTRGRTVFLTLVYLELREPDKARTHFDRAGLSIPTIAADEAIRRRLAGPAVR